MSWLARSIADSLRLDDVSEDEHNQQTPSSSSYQFKQQQEEYNENEEEEDPSIQGVKEDLTELKQTLTRQFWGVASFLAPPPPPPPPPPTRVFNQIQANNQRSGVVEEASNYYYYSDEEEDEEEDVVNNNAIGVTEEVMAFARNIAMHPETWLDFPIDEEDDFDDFNMSAAQREHAFAVERLAPRLAALRIELCPAHMSEGYFWKVYFVLLHSRLNRNDAELLSTSQVMAARSLWMKELHNQTKQERDWSARSTPRFRDGANSSEDEFHPRSYYEAHYGRLNNRTSACESAASDFEIVKHPIVSTEMHTADSSVIEDKPMIESRDKTIQPGLSAKVLVQDEEDDEDDWLREGNSDFGGYDKTFIPVGDEEDISFSDLEDDDDVSIPVKSKAVSWASEASTQKP